VKRSWLIDGLAIFLLTSILIWPLFKLVYLNNWLSIESTFIADGRMLSENLPHRQWQPLWYCGTRADYVYPPALRYGVAVLAKTLHIVPAHAYHVYIALFYAIGMVGIYVLVRVGSASRGFAWIAAMATAVLAPTFRLLPQVHDGNSDHAPQRLHVLINWGEGPHISALAILPFAFAAAILAVRRKNPAWVAVAAVAAAAVVSTNFYGLTALIILFPILAWACFVVEPNRRVLAYCAGIAALAYGLTAWWLVPSYLKVTSENLKLVAEPGNLWSVVIIIVVLLAFLVITFKIAPIVKSSYTIFVWSGFLFLSLYVLGRIYFHFQVAGDSTRLIPELDLFFIIAVTELLRWLWNLPVRRPHPMALRAAVALLVVVAFWSGIRYVKHSHRVFHEDHAWQERIEYRTQEWMGQNAAGKRALVTGSIRFWYDVWTNLPQMDGGSQQGLLNPNIVTAQYRILHGDDMELTRLWLNALAVDIAIIPENASEEIYHDVSEQAAGMWRKEFPVLRDDGEGNIYYRIDRRIPGIVRIVETARMKNLSTVPNEAEHDSLRAYVAAINAAPAVGDRLRFERPNTDQMNLQASLASGESILVQETFDSGWHAYVNEKPIFIEKDALGFMLLHPEPGAQLVVLRFEPTPEIRIGLILTLLSMITAALLMTRRTQLYHD
jgi:hypothetical protein